MMAEIDTVIQPWWVGGRLDTIKAMALGLSSLVLTVQEVNGLVAWMSSSPGPDHHFPVAQGVFDRLCMFARENPCDSK